MTIENKYSNDFKKFVKTNYSHKRIAIIESILEVNYETGELNDGDDIQEEPFNYIGFEEIYIECDLCGDELEKDLEKLYEHWIQNHNKIVIE